MRWRGGRQSSNIEDRRGGSPFGRGLGGGLGGGGFRFPGGRGGGLRGGGIGGLGLVIFVVAALLFGVDPGAIFGDLDGGGSPSVQRTAGRDDEMKQFVAVVLADTEDTWPGLLQEVGRQYSDPTLVLFDGGVASACGFAQSATGPLYCPGDRKGYLDLSFFDELARRFGAPGDFAQAYVIAHEVGHHVQTLLGISAQVRDAQARTSEAGANALQVRMELQADCFAGLWAHHADRARSILEQGDVEEALTAAAAIGDDTLQKRARGYVVPDSFTHGTGAQRVRWFRRGLESGELQACDTFAAESL